MKATVIHRILTYPPGSASLQWTGWAAFDLARPCAEPPAAPSQRPSGRSSSRWTSACSVADYDDVELLGRAVTSGPWYPVGLAIHAGNGALFGAAYAIVAPALPLPAVLRGPAAALFEHVALWPLGRVSDRVHPARDQLPRSDRQPGRVRCRRPGATCCSGSCWASSSAGQRRLGATRPRSGRGRRLIQRPRLAAIRRRRPADRLTARCVF